MDQIHLPSEVVVAQSGPSTYTLTFEPLFPGYGVTIGNALRRILFSSLPGAAVTAVKIKFVDHEFSTIPHIKEDVIQVILNIKQLVLRSHSTAPTRIKLHVQREGAVTAADIEETDLVQVINKDLHIATINDPKGELDIEFIVEQGRGYAPVESRENEKYELGVLAVDAIYTPVRAAYFNVSNARVGQMTNFDKLVMTIETDGSIDGKTALDLSARILIDHFSLLVTPTEEEVAAISKSAPEVEEIDNTETQEEAVETEETINDLDTLALSVRAKNALTAQGITSVATLKNMTSDEIRGLKGQGLGEKSLNEIIIALGKE